MSRHRMFANAETLCELGFATFLLDAFTARGVTSTVANQTQFSFAASAYDVLAAYRVPASRDDIDARRIGAQGHSRGGSTVLMAANRCLADAVIGKGERLAAVLAAYPWCGQQFENPSVGDTEVLVLTGDADEWCAPVQVQAQCHAIRLSGGKATMRLVAGAHHSYDRDTPLELIADASVAPDAPITYLSDTGAMALPTKDEPDPSLVDRDAFVYALKSGHGRRGAHIGSAPGEAEMFRNDMMRFWHSALASP